MARQKKTYAVTPVGDAPQPAPPLVRLESPEIAVQGPPIRLETADGPNAEPTRLAIPDPDEPSLRSQEPGIEVLIENPAAAPDSYESAWESAGKALQQVPWGWFALILILIASGVVWSLSRIQQAVPKIAKIAVEADATIAAEAKENQQAAALIERIERTTRQFFAAATLEELLRQVRNPERVRPLMENYYRSQPQLSQAFDHFELLQPITLDQNTHFWIASAVLKNQQKSDLMIEVLPSGETLVDWETYVNYQPIAWDEFVSSRPSEKSLDFRVYVEPDEFFSHEFADANHWQCYRLTALGASEALFGYVQKDSELANTLNNLMIINGQRRTSLILRLSIPVGLQSKRGVVIEKLLSNRWLYMDPPDPAR